MTSKRIALLGVGNIGAAIGLALLKADFGVTAWNRTPDRPQVIALGKKGMQLQRDIGAAIYDCDGIVIIALLDHKTIYDVLASEKVDAAVLAGKTVINLTTSTPGEARRAETWFKERGASRYIDGGIMAGPEMIGTQEALILYSGESKVVFESDLAKLLETLGRALYLGADAGAASLQDVVALTAMYGMFAGAFTGMAILKRQQQGGVKKSNADKENDDALHGVELVMMPMTSAMVPYLGRLWEAMAEERWADPLGTPLGMQLTALRTVLRTCREEGVKTDALEALAASMQRRVDDGAGEGGLVTAAKYLLE